MRKIAGCDYLRSAGLLGAGLLLTGLVIAGCSEKQGAPESSGKTLVILTAIERANVGLRTEAV